VRENNRGKTFCLQGTWTPSPKWAIVQSYMAGPEQPQNTSRWRHVFDTVVTHAVDARLRLQLNADYGMDKFDTGRRAYWGGISTAAKYEVTPWLSLAPRVEWFYDHDGFATGVAKSITEGTVTTEFKVTPTLLARLEFRRDRSNVVYFEKDAESAKSQFTTLVGVLYVFE
jgi:hypothetical protein